MKLTRIGVLILVLLTTLFYLGAGNAVFASDTIKIGLAGPFSGDLAPYGIPPKDTVRLAAEVLNRSGGLLGKQVQILAEDDQCKAGTATNVASKLVGEGVIAVIGHICSGATIAAMSVYRAVKIPVISPSATNPSLTLENKNPNFFRTIPHDAAQANLQVDFITRHLKAKKVAIVHDKGDYGKGLATLVAEGLKQKKVEIVIFEGITPGAVDYSALIRKVKHANPDVVAFGGYHPEGSKIVTQARKRNIKASFISGDGLKDPSFIKIGRKFVEGYYVSSPADISKVEISREITRILKSKNQKAGNFGLQAHAAVTAIFNAVKKTNSTDPEKLQKALRSEKIDTTLGMISFDKNGDILGSGFSMYQVRDGQFVPVKW
ncbi:MAG: branched-chain amino acid ABC transporter substrate-binding protein [Deltaproteobacteria bacterium]|nr:branched-chain amino acid ABC transporter substrate-binding protein [Deltaproteobacteria bacterium]